MQLLQRGRLLAFHTLTRMLVQAIDRCLTSDTQPHQSSLQLPAVLLQLFCKANTSDRSQDSSAFVPLPGSEAGSNSRRVPGTDPSADLHFFTHLLSLTSSAMRLSSSAANYQQVAASDSATKAEGAPAPHASDVSSSRKSSRKSAKRKRQEEVEASGNPPQATSRLPQNLAARWTRLVSSAADLLKAAQQLGVYRPNEDTSGANRAFLTQLATDVCSHIACLQQSKDLVGFSCLCRSYWKNCDQMHLVCSKWTHAASSGHLTVGRSILQALVV